MAPDEPESHLAQASVDWTLEWDWVAAREELEMALALDPDYVDARLALAEWYGVVAGDTDRGVREIERSKRLDPFSSWVGVMEGYNFIVGRRNEDAVRVYRAQREVNPEDPLAANNLALALAALGRGAEAVAILDQVLPGIQVPLRGSVVQAYALSGEEARARTILEEMQELRDGGGPVGALHLAMGYASLGEIEQALTWLERCFQDKGGTYALRDPAFDQLRGEPRFQVLWDRVGLPGAPPPAR